jgi:hypothetical protein
MITRLKLSTIEQGLPKYRSMLAGNDAYVPPAFESIASATGTGSSGTITFSAIPSTYTSLQIRAIVFSATNNSSVRLRFNGDSGNNYSYHQLSGTGSSAYASGVASISGPIVIGPWTGTISNMPLVGIIDIHDYTSTTRNKTVRAISGVNDNTTNDEISLTSGAWLNTNAVTSISLVSTSGNWATTTQFALYGIKGA